jgi:hypothetical protein
MGCHEGFLSKRVSIVLWLLLFKGGKVLEVFLVLEVFWRGSGQNRPDQFPLPVERLSPT